MSDEKKGIEIHVSVSEEMVKEVNRTLELLKTLGPAAESLGKVASLFGGKKKGIGLAGFVLIGYVQVWPF